VIAPRRSGPPTFRVMAAGSTVTVWIYDDIGPEWMGLISAKAVSEQLKKQSGASLIIVRLNSVGGDITEGLGIYNLLVKSGARVEVEIDGAAYSIASVVAMAGDVVRMAENALLMIHRPWTIAVGGSEELRLRADALDLMEHQAAGIYAARTGNSRKKVIDWMAAETWFTPDEAIANGFAHETTPNKAAAAKFDPQARGFRNMPSAAIARLHTVDRLDAGPANRRAELAERAHYKRLLAEMRN
jgi:ATP-dependent Clp protease protease subunit